MNLFLVLQVTSSNKNYSVKVPSELTLEELKNWLKAVCSGVGCCLGMIEIDTGEAAGRPCTLCGESTSNNVSSNNVSSNNVSSAVKRPNSVSTSFIKKIHKSHIIHTILLELIQQKPVVSHGTMACDT